MGGRIERGEEVGQDFHLYRARPVLGGWREPFRPLLPAGCLNRAGFAGGSWM